MLRDLIPARYRKVIYTVIAAVSTTEAALDAVEWGLIPNDIQAKALFVAAALGFTMAASNTATKPRP